MVKILFAWGVLKRERVCVLKMETYIYNNLIYACNLFLIFTHHDNSNDTLQKNKITEIIYLTLVC